MYERANDNKGCKEKLISQKCELNGINVFLGIKREIFKYKQATILFKK